MKKIGVTILLSNGTAIQFLVPKTEADKLLAGFRAKTLSEIISGEAEVLNVPGQMWEWAVITKEIVGIHTFFPPPEIQGNINIGPQGTQVPPASGFQIDPQKRW